MSDTNRGPATPTSFPDIGPTVPALALSALTFVAGAGAGFLVLGVSGWLVVALLLALGAAAVPRGPFAAILIVLLAVALVAGGRPGYAPPLIGLLAAGHLLVAVGSLSAWLPRRASVQLAVLRRPLLRYLVVQVAAQVVAFAVLALIRPAGAEAGSVWLGLVGAIAALALAAVVAPLLLRPAR